MSIGLVTFSYNFTREDLLTVFTFQLNILFFIDNTKTAVYWLIVGDTVSIWALKIALILSGNDKVSFLTTS